ncbi:TPA: hypothetical protein ACYLN4_000902 [Burkholderia lata]
MAIGKRAINRAAKIYGLALVANIDGAGADTDDQHEVVQKARENAIQALASMGIDAVDVLSIQHCIDVSAV